MYIKKIIAISGSLRTNSSNHAILQYFGSLVPEGIDYTIYDGLAQLPHFDPGPDNDQAHIRVTELRRILAEADGIIICSPEYAFGVPGSLKNLLDWTVGGGSLERKPLAFNHRFYRRGACACVALEAYIEKCFG